MARVNRSRVFGKGLALEVATGASVAGLATRHSVVPKRLTWWIYGSNLARVPAWIGREGNIHPVELGGGKGHLSTIDGVDAGFAYRGRPLVDKRSSARAPGQSGARKRLLPPRP